MTCNRRLGLGYWVASSSASDYELTTPKKQTKRENFLSKIEAVVLWQALIDLIEPNYHKVNKKGSRSPYPLSNMLQIHLLQK